MIKLSNKLLDMCKITSNMCKFTFKNTNVSNKMQTCNICNNHYQSLSAYKTHLERNIKCILMRNDIDKSTLNCQYCHELKSSKRFLEIHLSKCPKRIEILEEQNIKNLKLIQELQDENAKLLEANKLLKPDRDLYPITTESLYPITTESLDKCITNMLQVFKHGKYHGYAIKNIKHIHDEYLLKYLSDPLKFLVCDISRNKYKIMRDNQIIVDWNLCTTKKIIKQFLRNHLDDISDELDEILKSPSNQPAMKRTYLYNKEYVSYENFCDYIASKFYSGEYTDEFFQSEQFQQFKTNINK